MVLSDNACNRIIVITALILGFLGFSKELAKRYKRLRFLDNLQFKLVAVLICTFAAWKLTRIKDDNSAAEKKAVRVKERKDQVVFRETLRKRYVADSVLLIQEQIKIDSLKDIVLTKNDQIIAAQTETINEIKGSDLPWVQGNVVPMPAPLFVVSIKNLRKIPTNSVMVNFVDTMDYFTSSYPKDSAIDQQQSSTENSEWMFVKNITFPALAPDKEYTIYQKDLTEYKWGKLDYNFNVSWRGGLYIYSVVIDKVNNRFEVTYETFTYNNKSYNRRQFIAKFFSGNKKG